MSFHYPADVDGEMKEFLNIQFEFFWTSCFSALPESAIWYNDWRMDYAVDRNAYQLKRAAQIGFCVPDTLITSSDDSAIAFMKKHKKVALKQFGGSRSLWMTTTLATKEYIEKMWVARRYPVILQEYIEGRFDYRIIVIDDAVTAVEFDTGSSSYAYDVRVDLKTSCREIAIEPSYSEALINVVKSFGLRYGAIDLRRRYAPGQGRLARFSYSWMM